MKRRSAMNLRSTNPNAIGMKQVMFKNRVEKQGIIEDFLNFPLFLFYKCGNSAIYSKYETGVLIYIQYRETTQTVSLSDIGQDSLTGI